MEKEIPDTILGTVYELLIAKGMADAARIIYENENLTIKKADCDSWNNIQIWNIHFYVSPLDYNRLEARLEEIENQIARHLNIVLETDTGNAYSVTIKPRKLKSTDWRAEVSELPTNVRINIIDNLRHLEDRSWSGQLDCLEFLDELYDLQGLPSQDSRYTNAYDDICQHCVSNDDWDEDWIFDDNRFKLKDGPTEIFLQFLCKTIHPEVLPDRDEAVKMTAIYNKNLRPTGWEIIEDRKKFGYPGFVPRKLSPQEKLAAHARSSLESLDASYIAGRIEEMEQAINDTPARAIGDAKELLESCCKIILTKEGLSVSDLKKLNVQELTKQLFKKLKLVDKDVSDAKKGAEIIKSILRNLGGIPQNLAELRNYYGDGHGKDGRFRGLQPRHARLAVTTAIGFVNFMVDTYHEREEVKNTKYQSNKQAIFR